MIRLLCALFFCLAVTNCGFFHDLKEPSAEKTSALPPNANFMTAAQWLELSMTYYRQSRFLESIAASQTALYLKPDLAEAYNNIGAAYGALHVWDPAILADQQALRLRADFQLAKNNLGWALEQKRLGNR